MKKVIPVFKPEGMTPLELVKLYRQKLKLETNVKLGYMGRLDPLASGIILLLVGEENKNRDKYLNLDKEYEFSALLGLESDSYDILGILCSDRYNKPPENFRVNIDQFVSQFHGVREQPYPPYSSKPVKGHALFVWARQGKLNEIEIPKKQITIYKLEILGYHTNKIDQVIDQAISRIKLVNGDFRQFEIINKWQSLNIDKTYGDCIIMKFRVHCSSGTYVRQLVHEMGQFLGCGALTWEIKRIKFGKYGIKSLARNRPKSG